MNGDEMNWLLQTIELRAGNLFSTTFESFIPLPNRWLRLDCSRQAIFYVKSGRLGR